MGVHIDRSGEISWHCLQPLVTVGWLGSCRVGGWGAWGRRAARAREAPGRGGGVAMRLRRDGLDPVAELGRWRREAPIARLTRVLGTDVWLVSGYEQARWILADHHGFSNDIRSLVGRADATGADAIGGLGST